jgi:hypothetical protein
MTGKQSNKWDSKFVAWDLEIPDWDSIILVIESKMRYLEKNQIQK